MKWRSFLMGLVLGAVLGGSALFLNSRYVMTNWGGRRPVLVDRWTGRTWTDVGGVMIEDPDPVRETTLTRWLAFSSSYLLSSAAVTILFVFSWAFVRWMRRIPRYVRGLWSWIRMPHRGVQPRRQR